MPLSVAALISGMMTLIASSPNMIIEGTLRAHGLAPLDFFGWTAVRPCGAGCGCCVYVGRTRSAEQATRREGRCSVRAERS